MPYVNGVFVRPTKKGSKKNNKDRVEELVKDLTNSSQKEVKKTFKKQKGMNTSIASKQASINFPAKIKNEEKLAKGEKYLDQLWKNYLEDVADIILINPKEDKKDFIKNARQGWANRGRELEFKLFFISGNIEDFDAQDNFPAWAAGDLMQEIDLTDGGKKIIDAQVKGPGASLEIPKGIPKEKELKRRRSELEEMLRKMSKEALNKANYVTNFENATVKKIPEAVELTLTIDKRGKEVIQTTKREESIKDFIKIYIQLSASEYFLFGLEGSLGSVSDFVLSMKEERLEQFVDIYTNMFHPKFNSKNEFIGLRYYPKFNTPFITLLTAGNKNGFHLHGIYGQEHFTKNRNEEFKGANFNEYRNAHINLLQSRQREFEEVHLAFFGRDYTPIQDLKRR